MTATAKQFSSFREFYPFYLGEHANRACRRLHFVGTSIAALLILHTIATLNFWWLLAALVVGYAFAWVGHYRYERNRPATFTYPFYSFAGDWVMWKQILTGQLRF